MVVKSSQEKSKNTKKTKKSKNTEDKKVAPKAKKTGVNGVEKEPKKKTITTFPAGRIKRYLKEPQRVKISENALAVKFSFERVGRSAPIYLAAVLDSISRDLLSLAGDSCAAESQKVLKPRHILQAVREDEEYSELLKKVDFLGGIGDYAPMTSFSLKDLTEEEMKESKIQKAEKKIKKKEKNSSTPDESEENESDEEDESNTDSDEEVQATQHESESEEEEEEDKESEAESEKDLISDAESEDY
eukprot:gene10969-3677_t